MDDRYESNDSLVSWMIAGGARIDEPDPRHLLHLVALRDARRESIRSIGPIAWLTARFGTSSSAAAAASAAAAPISTTCCAPA